MQKYRKLVNLQTMQRIHFIAIGSTTMHNLAIAVSKKNSFVVSGSDNEIEEPLKTRLKANGILPDKTGWFPERITKNLSAVIVGSNVDKDNCELLKANELGLKIYSFPEFLFQQTRSKTRIVVAGNAGKSITAAMIVFVLKQLRIDTDYLLSTTYEGIENSVKLTYESRIAVFEGDENATSALDDRPRFHLYKPQIAALIGIDLPTDVNADTKEKLEVFSKFIDLMEVQGRLIYLNSDKQLCEMTQNLRRDIVPFGYSTANYKVVDGVYYINTKKSNLALLIEGEKNMQYLEAARLACKQIGVTDEQFYNAVAKFSGKELV